MPQAPYTTEQAEEDIAELRGQVDRMGEILTVANTAPNPPNSVNSAIQVFNAGGTLNTYDNQGMQYGMQGAQLATFPGTTVTAASLTTIASGTVNGFSPGPGKVYELEVWGNGVQGSTAQSLEFGVSFGGNAMSNITFGTQAFGGTPASAIFRFLVIGRVICVTSGTSGTFTSYINGVVSVFGVNLSPNSSNQASGFSCESTGTTTINTHNNQTLAVQAAWGATTGGPTLTSRVSVFKKTA